LALAGSPASLWVMVVDDGGCGVREAGGSRGQGSARADKKKKKKKNPVPLPRPGGAAPNQEVTRLHKLIRCQDLWCG